MRKTTVTLADGRALIYFGQAPARPADYPDRRRLAAVQPSSRCRYDRLRGEWVVIAGHRQDRTYRPAGDQCPLCPSSEGRLTEIPAPEYDVAVLENRFPALTAGPGDPGPPGPGGTGAAGPRGAAAPDGLLLSRPAAGRSEVICFSPRHTACFADLTPAQIATVMAAWVDRSVQLARLPGVQQIYCFENRGREIGVTLAHPHGQIYAYPFVAPGTLRALQASAAYRERTGRNLADDLLAAERSDGSRMVLEGRHWAAFVPYAARWPYEVHLYPRRRVPDLAALPDAARAEFCDLYGDLLARFDRLFGAPAPYLAGWHQAPVRQGRDDFALHLELFTVRRTARKLKYLAGSELGMGAFVNDVEPEAAASRLRRAG